MEYISNKTWLFEMNETRRNNDDDETATRSLIIRLGTLRNKISILFN